jgi:hypothetical protein
VFTKGVAASESAVSDFIAGKDMPTIAATTGGAAYATIYRDDGREDAYRTTDWGRTWQPVPGAAAFGTSYTSDVTEDGRHVVVVMNAHASAELWASENGGPYRRAHPPGYPESIPGVIMPRHPAAGRHVGWTDDGIYLSDDGWQWRSVPVP